MKETPRYSVSFDIWSSNPALPLKVVRIWLLPPDMASDLLPKMTVMPTNTAHRIRRTIFKIEMRVAKMGLQGQLYQAAPDIIPMS